MKPRLRSWIGLGLVTLGACAAPEPAERVLVAGSGDLAGALQGVRTIEFHPDDRVLQPFPGTPAEALRADLESALARGFRVRGYRLGQAGGERRLGYALGVSGELADERLASEFGISAGLDLEGAAGRAGLVLVLSDARTGLPLWRAAGSAEIGGAPLAREERLRRIEEAVETLLVSLPRR